MGRKPGSILARGPDRWLVRVFQGFDGEGKRIYVSKTVRGARKDAQKWLNETLRNRDLGVRIDRSYLTLNEYLDRWLQDAVEPKVRSSTYLSYRDCLRLHVRGLLGGIPLEKLRPLDVQNAVSQIREKGLSPRTVQYTLRVLKQALKQAVAWRILAFNPCEGVKAPKQVRKEMQALSVSEARRFIAAAREDPQGLVLVFAMTTGLRPSEYLALKWADLDERRGVVSINRSLERAPDGSWRFAENKTLRSRRTVRLQGHVLAWLAEWRVQQQAAREAVSAWADLDLIFTNAAGGPLDRHNLARRHLRPVLQAAGLEQIRLYDLRHTFATLALSAGVPVKVVSEALGHASAVLTLDTYSHVLPHMQDEAAARVEALLLEAPPKRLKA